MVDALRHFEEITVPGAIETLDYAWAADDEWKDGVMRPKARGGHGDDRVERFDTPQYQSEADSAAAEEVLAGGGCRTCIWLE